MTDHPLVIPGRRYGTEDGISDADDHLDGRDDVVDLRRRRARLLACLVVMAFIVSAPGSAAAFGTIDTGGQRREHDSRPAASW
jgi:hypothetical protein